MVIGKWLPRTLMTMTGPGGGLIAKDENLEFVYGFRHIKWNGLQNPGKAGQNSQAKDGAYFTKSHTKFRAQYEKGEGWPGRAHGSKA